VWYARYAAWCGCCGRSCFTNVRVVFASAKCTLYGEVA
jgi:hypothetical protein